MDSTQEHLILARFELLAFPTVCPAVCPKKKKSNVTTKMKWTDNLFLINNPQTFHQVSPVENNCRKWIICEATILLFHLIVAEKKGGLIEPPPPPPQKNYNKKDWKEYMTAWSCIYLISTIHEAVNVLNSLSIYLKSCFQTRSVVQTLTSLSNKLLHSCLMWLVQLRSSTECRVSRAVRVTMAIHLSWKWFLDLFLARCRVISL